MNVKKILCVPKSLLYNLAIFGWGGVKLPILFSNNVRIKGIRRKCITVNSNQGRVFLGFKGVDGIQPFKKTYIIIGKTGEIEFKGNAFVAEGTTIRVDNGVCTFGKNFSCNTNCFISCTEKVTFGDNCLLGWNVNVRDSDGHTIILNGIEQASLKSVKIGRDVWIAANVDILKGVTIGDANVIGYRSCVTKSVNEEHCIIAGYPAKIVRREINWKR